MAKGKGIKINIGAVGAQETVKSIQKVAVSAGSVVKAIAPIAIAVGAVKALGAAFSQTAESVDAFNVQAEAVDRLSFSLRRAGVSARDAVAGQLEFASALQQVTNVGDETTIALQAQALQLGVSQQDLNQTTMAAVGLSKALGIDLDSAMAKTVDVMKGNTQAFGDMIPELYGVADPFQRLAVINQIAAAGFQESQNETATLRGTMARLSGATGDLMERFGELLEPILKVVNVGIAKFVEAVNGMMEPAIKNVGSLMERVTPIVETIISAVMQFGGIVAMVFNVVTEVIASFATAVAEMGGGVTKNAQTLSSVFLFLRNGIVKALTFVEVMLLNFPEVVKMAFLSAKLSITTFVLDVKYFFTTELPAYFVWFAENFVNIMRDGFVGAFTIVKNFITNVSEAMNVLMDYLSGNFVGGWEGVTTRLGDIASKSLLDGFEAQTAELPNIAARAMTAGEEQMKAEIGNIATNLADEYNQKVADRLGKLDALGGAFKGMDFKGFDFGLRTGQGMGIGKSATQLSAQESRLMTRGPNQDPFQQRMLRAFEQIAKNTEETAKNTETDTEASPGETEIAFEVIP